MEPKAGFERSCASHELGCCNPLGMRSTGYHGEGSGWFILCPASDTSLFSNAWLAQRGLVNAKLCETSEMRLETGQVKGLAQ